MLDSNRQKNHYQRIHASYESHYFDATSIKYREEFILDPLFKNAKLENKRILDLACGSGYNSVYLKKRFPGLTCVGLDISEDACVEYRKNTGEIAYMVDLTRSIDIAEKFDAAVIIGGLHHCIADLPQTLRNIASLLKPGGLLYMMEPSSDFFLNGLRSRWYKADRYFDAETEDALSHSKILTHAKDFFESVDLRYFGGPAYFLLLNSLIMRIPLSVKPWLAPMLFLVERGYQSISSPITAPCFIASWRTLSAEGNT
jgi:SAM-dependent methyltransferase